jgi:hypothetical protein
MEAYEDRLQSTSTSNAPWYVVPADDKWNARLITSQILIDTFHSLKMTYPNSTPEHLTELKSIRETLEAEQ